MAHTCAIKNIIRNLTQQRGISRLTHSSIEQATKYMASKRDHQHANIIIYLNTHSIVEDECRGQKGLKWPQTRVAGETQHSRHQREGGGQAQHTGGKGCVSPVYAVTAPDVGKSERVSTTVAGIRMRTICLVAVSLGKCGGWIYCTFVKSVNVECRLHRMPWERYFLKFSLLNMLNFSLPTHSADV